MEKGMREVKLNNELSSELTNNSEIIAQEREKQENEEREPKTAKELIMASTDALESLQSFLSRNSKAYEVLLEINQRLARYLGNQEKVSDFAKKITIDPSSIIVSEINNYLVAELNPLLFQLHQAIIKNNSSTQTEISNINPLIEKQNLFKELSVGRINNQKVTTIFGLIEDLRFDKPKNIKKIVVIDPLDMASNEKYWQDRIDCTEVYGENKKAKEIIAMRSDYAAYQLELEAQKAKQENDEKLLQAYSILAEFMDGQANNMREDFVQAVSKIDFVHGQADDIFNLLNAAELIKHDNPDLYARLLGVATDHKSNSEAKRSDLFGNAFQIAVVRSQKLSVMRNLTGPEIIGKKVLQERIKKIVDLEASQLPLRHINIEQMHFLEKELKEEVMNDTNKRNPVTIASLTATLLKHQSEHQLHDFLELVALEEREETLKEMEICFPERFIEIIKSSPEKMVLSSDFKSLVASRLGLDNEDEIVATINNIRKFDGKKTSILSDIYKDIVNTEKNDAVSINKAEDEIKLRLALWQTVSSEKLLSKSFLDSLEDVLESLEIIEHIVIKGKEDSYTIEFQNSKIAPKRKKIAQEILAVLSSHQDITKSDWLKWLEEREKEQLVNLFQRNTAANRHKKVSEILEKVFNLFDSENTASIRTYFYALDSKLTTTRKIQFAPEKDKAKFKK